MERTHGQLCTRLTDGLCRNDTNRFAHCNGFAVSQIVAIAFGANAIFGFTVENGTYLQLRDTSVHNLFGVAFVHHFVFGHQQLTSFRMQYILNRITAHQALGKRFDHLVAIANVTNLDALVSTAIVLTDNHFLRNVHQTSGQITGVGSTQRGIGQTFSRASRRNKVFQNVQAFTVVRANRNLNRFTGGVGDQSAHTGQLTNLVHTTTSTRVGHHEDWVVLIQVVFQGVRYFVSGFVPGFDDHLITLIIGNQTSAVLLGNLFDLLIGFFHQFLFLRRNDCVTNCNSDSAASRIFKALCLNSVQHFRCGSGAMHPDTFFNNLTQLLFADQKLDFQLEHILRLAAVNITQILRNRIIENDSTHGRFNQLRVSFAVDYFRFANFNFRVQTNDAFVIGHHRLFHAGKSFSLAGFSIFFQCQIIRTKHHILRWNRYRATVGRFQQVVGGQHQKAGFRLCFCRQRHVNRHLIAVEVGVVSSTYQRMQLKSTAFYQNWLKRLNAQSMQRRRTVQQNRMVFDYNIQRIPNLGAGTFHHFSGVFDIRRRSGIYQALHNERLE